MDIRLRSHLQNQRAAIRDGCVREPCLFQGLAIQLCRLNVFVLRRNAVSQDRE